MIHLYHSKYICNTNIRTIFNFDISSGLIIFFRYILFVIIKITLKDKES